MKKIIRLTESDLHKIIKESVERVLRESNVSGNYRATPSGGFDEYAFNYDDALDDAESVEDWDERMKYRERCARNDADWALNHHPQSSKFSQGSKTYTAGFPLDYISIKTDANKENYGFSH